MAQRLPELVGRVMIDPEFLADLQRAPDSILAQYDLTDDERATVLAALARLGQTSAGQRAVGLRSAPIRPVATSADNDAVLLVLDRAALAKLTEVSPRAAAAFFESLVLIFIERLRASGDLVAEVTRWGLEATGLDVESR